MTGSNPYGYFCSWMDKPMIDPSTGLVTEEFADGIKQFMDFFANQKKALQKGKIRCPFANCMNRRYGTTNGVYKKLYRDGFMKDYRIWYAHGENESMVDFASSMALFTPDRMEETKKEHDP